MFWLILSVLGFFFIIGLQIENVRTYNGKLNESPYMAEDEDDDLDSISKASPVKN